jgi:hypothetical protein
MPLFNHKKHLCPRFLPAENSELDSKQRSQKATINFVLSVCPSVRMSVCMNQLGSHWTHVDEIYIWAFFFFNLLREFEFH